MVDAEEGSLEYKQIGKFTNLLKQKSSAVTFSFAWFLHFFNDHFLLFVLASVIAATKADMLNKIAGVLKYSPDKIDSGVRGNTADTDEWDGIF